MILDVLRVGLSPILVAAASLASRKWGDAVGGWLAGFPFVAGPILLVIALEQGCPFAAKAAQSALLGMVSLVAFAVWFGKFCHRGHWGVALVSGWIIYLGVAWALAGFQFGLLANFVLVLVVLGVGAVMLPHPGGQPQAPVGTPNRWDIPMRMTATLVLVSSITLSAKHMGANWSGLLTPFPVATTVLSVFAYLSGGEVAVARFLRGFVPGLLSLAVFFAVLAFDLPSFGLTGFVIALTGSLAVHAGIGWFRSRA